MDKGGEELQEETEKLMKLLLLDNNYECRWKCQGQVQNKM
jgi:hypothetical protein